MAQSGNSACTDRQQSLMLAASCAIGLAVGLSGCQSPTPRADIETSRAIAEAVGLAAPVQFIVVGPEGGPTDEPDTTGASLTLVDAVRRAVTTDPELQAAMARIRIACADSDQARLLPNPVLNVVLRWGNGKPQIEASLAQDFIQALQIPRRASSADNRLRQVAAESLTVALDVTNQVQERYTAAQAAAALSPLLRERLTLLEKLTATAKARLDTGEGTRGDLATLNAQRVEMEVKLDGARLDEREERLRLARLVGEPSSAATWTLDSWTAPLIGDQPEASWVETGLRYRPEIQSIVWRLRSLGDEEALVRLLPWEGARAGADVQRGDQWFAGPSISSPLPVFDTGQARLARVRAEQMEARHDLTQAKRKVIEEVRVAYQNLTASTANLSRIRNELVPLQRERRQLAEDAYRAGQTDVTALFLAEQDLRVAQANSIEVERRALIAMSRLHRAVGGPGIAASMAGAAAPAVLPDSEGIPPQTRQP